MRAARTRPLTNRVSTLFFLFCALIVAPLAAESSARSLPEEAQLLAMAEPVSLVSPFYCVDKPIESELFLTNVFGQPIEATVTALSSYGDPYPLGTFDLAPGEHIQLSLHDMLPDTHAFYAGMMRIEYVGTVTMLEAWMVMSTGEPANEQHVEWPFVRMGKEESLSLSSFWDARHLSPDIHPTYRLANASDDEIRYTLRLGQGAETLMEEERTLAPGHVDKLTPRKLLADLRFGWIEVEHQGMPDGLSAVGWLSLGPPGETPFVTTLPIRVKSPEHLPTELHSAGFSMTGARALDVPQGVGRSLDALRRPLLALRNDSDIEQSLQLSVLEMKSGEEILSHEVTLAPRAIRSFDLSELWNRHSELLWSRLGPSDDFRLRLRGGTDALQAWAATVDGLGAFTDVEVFEEPDVHISGLYPLPPLSDFEVVNTLINLGSQPANIRAQVQWDGGAYALPSISIPPGEAREIRLDDLAAHSPADLLGRTFDPDYTNGLLQWTAGPGSHKIVDRLEARERGGSRDVFGFRYNTCCYSESRGDLIPGSAVLDFGVSEGFQASEYIDNCIGTIGPYDASSGASLSYTSPVSWDGVDVSASTDASQTLSFSNLGQDIDIGPNGSCITNDKLFGDNGPVVADECRDEHNPDHDPAKACSQQSTSCSDCYSCCEAERDVSVCQCESIFQDCEDASNVTCGKCKEVCFGTFLTSCSTQQTTCS